MKYIMCISTDVCRYYLVDLFSPVGDRAVCFLIFVVPSEWLVNINKHSHMRSIEWMLLDEQYCTKTDTLPS